MGCVYVKSLKPKKTDFNTRLGIALQKIFDRLAGYNCKCSMAGSTMTISDFEYEDTSILDVIKETVREVFECKKIKKYCKLNYFNKKLYLRFKNKL